MIHKKRLSIAVLAGILIEILNKIVPLYIIHFAQNQLGVSAFGYAQFGITMLELAFPFVTFGYNNYGTVRLGKIQDDRLAVRSLISNMVALRMIHAVVVFFGLVAITTAVPNYHAYKTIVIALSFTLVIAGTEMMWVHFGIQKIAQISFFSGLGRLVSFVAILACIRQPDDAVLYAVLTFVANAIVGVLTSWYCWRLYPLLKPSWTAMKGIFRSSRHYALILLMMLFLERIDLIVAEAFYGTEGAGLYAGPQRITHSLWQVLNAVVIAFFSEMVVVSDKGSLTKHLRLSVWILSMMLLPVCFGIWFVAGGILDLILGPEYIPLGSTLSLLVVSLVGTTAFSVFGLQILMVKENVTPLARALALATGLSVAAAVFLAKPYAYPGIAFAMLFGKVVGAGFVVAAARPYLDGLPVKQALKALLPALIMTAALYALPLPRFWQTILLGAFVFAMAAAVTNRAELKKAWAAWKNRHAV